MNKQLNGVEILLVEDNLRDAELAIRALRKVNLANHVVHVKDGVALDFIFAKGRFQNVM
ncbi:MAG: two-component system response regulator [Segetibacter sp.]|jgi:CheY-like chemotaxis protein|nr:two-component system response regulator [Segetibacter sp.]